MPADCSPSPEDVIQINVTAADLPGVGSCTVHAHCSTTTAVDGSGAPRELSLAMADRNPFHGSTRFAYAIPRRAEVRLDVFTVAGRRVRTLASGEKAAGRYTATLDAHAPGEPALDAGVYFVALTAGGERKTLTVIALR
jgi:hypothetical protein